MYNSSLFCCFLDYHRNERVPELLASVNNIYPNIDVKAAIPYGSKMKSSDYETTTFYSFVKT